ncbi:hypothetical protein [Rhizobium leguminosarum]|uniref:hypothetical protein n=1 Tax=Rhizobium leguminosarum TaxID=384 RepID=UPI00144168F9|nr:hypothetical protein [Rhizobium leguminosarum]NKL05947.1 hypothetical protein [Rhizobium leguminosarum bv. viciae]NKL84584.1 hypothetical protein [Rhizobium leguminosarum bv. viciae]NKL92484.1 hypothetical protein [Rhizobium leguminosarum bv. viciae]NKM92466.1 hypothetical protein [Rhizobium leguminosarum bv. viciae]
MAPVKTFGFSFLLKLVCLNPKPQKRAVRERHKPSKSGFDYHRSLRLRIQQIAFEGLSKAQVGIDGSDNEGPERASAKRGLQRFFTWREDNPGLLEACPALTFLSPKGFFKVIFQPDFLSELDGRRTAVHVWNTQQELSSNLVLAALCAVAIRFPPQHRPDDFAALSLQDGRFYRWSDATREHAALGENLLAMLDTQCELARTELGIPAIGPEVPLPIA